MRPHHELALSLFINNRSKDADIISILLGGSVARGKDREDSDIDLMVIVSDEAYEAYVQKNKLFELSFDDIKYQGGYFDIKYFSKSYLTAAAMSGSEPTRSSFAGVKEVFSKDRDISRLLQQIPIYPVHEKKEKIRSFYAAFELNGVFFWPEARRDNNRYLQLRSATDIVLFGLRMVLAHNEILFPSHKWLFRTVELLESKPDGCVEKARRFLDLLTDASKQDFYDTIVNWLPKDRGYEPLAQYLIDNEQWWFYKRPVLAEW